MKPWSRILIAVPVLLLPAVARAQVAPEKALSTFTVHADGLELSLWASEEVGGFCNPTCIDVDHKGRVWVCESVNYRHTLHHIPTAPARGRPHRHPGRHQGRGQSGQRHRLLPVAGNPGAARHRRRQGPGRPRLQGLRLPVARHPRLQDKNGDGKADGPPKKLLTGFGGFDHDHGVHGILIGPDMKLYFSVGDPGGVRQRPAKLRRQGPQVDTATTPTAGPAPSGAATSTAQNLELIAHNFRNEYEPCVDSFGTVFVSDNDDDGKQQTRICYVMPGGNYGYHPPAQGQTTGTRSSPASCRKSSAPISARRPACASTKARCCRRSTGASCCTPTPARARSAATT